MRTCGRRSVVGDQDLETGPPRHRWLLPPEPMDRPSAAKGHALMLPSRNGTCSMARQGLLTDAALVPAADALHSAGCVL